MVVSVLRLRTHSGDTPFSIFLALSKTFDMLDHDILVTKLKHYGIDDTPLTWFKKLPH